MRIKKFTPLENPAIYGGDEAYEACKGFVPFRKGGVKAPSFLTGFSFSKQIFGALASLTILVVISGCSAITIPDPEDVVKHPLGTESIKIGMTKAQVESIWGRPNTITTAQGKEKWQGSREVWVYNAQYGAIPVDAGYLSKTKKLYFDGENLTEIGE